MLENMKSLSQISKLCSLTLLTCLLSIFAVANDQSGEGSKAPSQRLALISGSVDPFTGESEPSHLSQVLTLIRRYNGGQLTTSQLNSEVEKIVSGIRVGVIGETARLGQIPLPPETAPSRSDSNLVLSLTNPRLIDQFFLGIVLQQGMHELMMSHRIARVEFPTPTTSLVPETWDVIIPGVIDRATRRSAYLNMSATSIFLDSPFVDHSSIEGWTAAYHDPLDLLGSYYRRVEYSPRLKSLGDLSRDWRASARFFALVFAALGFQNVETVFQDSPFLTSSDEELFMAAIGYRFSMAPVNFPVRFAVMSDPISGTYQDLLFASSMNRRQNASDSDFSALKARMMDLYFDFAATVKVLGDHNLSLEGVYADGRGEEWIEMYPNDRSSGGLHFVTHSSFLRSIQKTKAKFPEEFMAARKLGIEKNWNFTESCETKISAVRRPRRRI